MGRHNKQIHLMLTVSGLSLDYSNELEWYIQAAQTAERAKIELLYLDHTWIEPSVVMASLLSATDHIGIGSPVSTEVIEPFEAARSLAALDHFSKGRSAWYAERTSKSEPQRRIDPSLELTEDALTERNLEFIQVAEQLWSSWEEDALLIDREQGRFIDSSKVHRIHHVGKHFQVLGPLSIPRPPQGRPVRISFEESSGADVIVTPPSSRHSSQQAKVLTTVKPILGDTEQEAIHYARALNQLDTEVGGLQPSGAFVGTAMQLADWMEQWVTAGYSDGFNLQPYTLSSDLDQIVSKVIPLLQSRGLYRTGYTSSTLRGHLGLGTTFPLQVKEVN